MFDEPFEPGRNRRRQAVGRVFLAFGLVLLTALAIMPSPYVIERPGSAEDVLGDSAGEAIIQITDARSYPTSGELNMLTVQLVGSPSQTPSWLELAAAWLDPAQTIIPLSEAYPDNQTFQQSEEESAAMMDESQRTAAAAALAGLGFEVPRKLYVAQVFASSPASGKLKADDLILEAAGVKIDQLETLREIIANNKAKPLSLLVERSGQSIEIVLTPYLDEGTYRIGILTGYQFELPVGVKFAVGDIGGPSAGMIFALAITDKLTPGSLTGGLNVAGTGTIDADGAVGPIGGIQQKMYAAVRGGSTVMLAPSENCDEVVGHIPAGLSVVKVSTLAEAKAALAKLAAGSNASSLPQCSTK